VIYKLALNMPKKEIYRRLNEHNKQAQIIERMAEYIANQDIDEDICKVVSQGLIDIDGGICTIIADKGCKQCVIDYFGRDNNAD
jgi:hypothetical protein